MSREEYKHRVEERLEDSRDEFEVSKDILVLLGAIPEHVDLVYEYISIQSNATLGFFDLESGEIVLIGQGHELQGFDEVVYAHEFAHALQSQHFNLVDNNERFKDDSEAYDGWQALIEGSATLLMIRYMNRYLDPKELKRIQDQPTNPNSTAPSFLKSNVNFPYREGLTFAASLFQVGGWTAIDSAHSNPPTSTEQVLHPDKYRLQEHPMIVVLPDITKHLGDGWREVERDVIGEFDLKLILAEHVSESRAAVAAAGWGGDQFIYLKGPTDERLLVSLIRWDSGSDATEFVVEYARWLEAKDLSPTSATGQLLWSEKGRASSLQLEGDHTLLILAPTAGIRDQVSGIFMELI